MAARVESLDGVRLDNPARAIGILKALPQADRVYIREVYDKMEADVDTSVEVSCDHPACSAEFSFPLDLGQGFFSNAAGSGASESDLNWI